MTVKIAWHCSLFLCLISHSLHFLTTRQCIKYKIIITYITIMKIEFSKFGSVAQNISLVVMCFVSTIDLFITIWNWIRFQLSRMFISITQSRHISIRFIDYSIPKPPNRSTHSMQRFSNFFSPRFLLWVHRKLRSLKTESKQIWKQVSIYK